MRSRRFINWWVQGSFANLIFNLRTRGQPILQCLCGMAHFDPSFHKKGLTMQLKERIHTFLTLSYNIFMSTSFFGHCFKHALFQVGFPSSVLVITWRSTELAIFEDGWPNSIRDPLLAAWRHRRGGWFQHIFHVYPFTCGRWSNLTNIFQVGLKPPTPVSSIAGMWQMSTCLLYSYSGYCKSVQLLNTFWQCLTHVCRDSGHIIPLQLY